MRAERRTAGFSLLEVLAAVAVLGLVYSVLATAGIQGLRLEGDAGRRLRASLLAEQKIVQLEAMVATGQSPELGVTEDEAEDFLVTVEVTPLDLEIGDTKASKRGRERLERAIGGRDQGETAPGSLLGPGGAGAQPLLRRVDVRVAWTEGEAEQAVGRTTYALDSVAAAPLIATLVAAAERDAAEAQRSATDAAAGTSPAPGEAASTAQPPADGAAGLQRLRALPGAAPDAETGGSE